MIALILLAQVATNNLSEASDKAHSCVLSEARRLERSREPADIVADAAMTACLGELVDLRVSLTAFTKSTSPNLSDSDRRSVDQNSFELAKRSMRDQAILDVVRQRAGDVSNR